MEKWRRERGDIATITCKMLLAHSIGAGEAGVTLSLGAQQVAANQLGSEAISRWYHKMECPSDDIKMVMTKLVGSQRAYNGKLVGECLFYFVDMQYHTIRSKYICLKTYLDCCRARPVLVELSFKFF